LQNLEGKVQERFELEMTARRDMEKRLMAIVEERIGGLKNEVSKESKNRFESIEHLKNCLENDFPKL